MANGEDPDGNEQEGLVEDVASEARDPYHVEEEDPGIIEYVSRRVQEFMSVPKYRKVFSVVVMLLSVVAVVAFLGLLAVAIFDKEIDANNNNNSDAIPSYWFPTAIEWQTAWKPIPSIAKNSPENTGKGYYTQPNSQGDTVVFISEGDVWRFSLVRNPQNPSYI